MENEKKKPRKIFYINSFKELRANERRILVNGGLLTVEKEKKNRLASFLHRMREGTTERVLTVNRASSKNN